MRVVDLINCAFSPPGADADDDDDEHDEESIKTTLAQLNSEEW